MSRGILLFFLFLLIFSNDCVAQSHWNFIPSVTFSETYNSNLFSTTTEVDDYITSVGTNLNVVYSGPSVTLGGNYLLSLNGFARNAKENVVTQDGRFDIDLNRWFRKFFKSSNVTVREDFTFTPDLKDYYFDEERGEIGSLSSYGIRTRRTDAFRNAFGLNVLFPVTHKISLSTSYTNLLTEYKAVEFRDNLTNTVGIGMSYAFPGDMFYSNIGVSNTRADREDSNNYSLGLGIRHSISQLTTVDMNAGIVMLAPETGDNESTFRGGISLTTRSKTRTTNIGYSRSLNAISGISGRPTAADIFYINITNVHSQVLTSNIGANYSVNRSIRGDDVDINSFNLSGGLTYSIRKWLRSSFSASHFNQESNRPSPIDLKRNMVTFALTGTWN